MKVSVVAWMWGGSRTYKPQYVNVLASMFSRHLSLPHDFVCVTDSPASAFSKGVRVVPMPPAAQALGNLKTPEGGIFPSCYRRLWMFSDEARMLGDRLLLVDVDMVLMGNIDHLFDETENFVGWRPRKSWGASKRVGGGIYLLTAGSMTHVYDDFKGEESIRQARNAGHRGSDQAWMSYKLGRDATVWGADSGIYSVRDFRLRPPADARLVQFNGQTKPWDRYKHHWKARHWK